MWHTLSVKVPRYIELKSGHFDDGPAWIGYATQSKSGRTLYFNGRGLMKLKGQRRGESGGNYIDMETGESFWVSGVKKEWRRSPLGRIGQGTRRSGSRSRILGYDQGEELGRVSL